jgi:hypothetical protein
VNNHRLIACLLASLAMAGACEPFPEITIVGATYGANCQAAAGNATAAVARACDGHSTCRFQVDVAAIGDPSPGCAKEFDIVWRCPGEEAVRRMTLPAEAGLGSVARLSC